MKRIIGTLSIAVLACCAATSCTKDSGAGLRQVDDGGIVTFEAVQEFGTLQKTVLDGSGTSVQWLPKDSISIFYGTVACGKFIGTNTDTVAKASFKGKFDDFDGNIEVGDEEKNFWAVYPYDKDAQCFGDAVSVTVPAIQTAVEGSFGPDLFPSVARSSGLTLSFYNVCGGIMFTVDDVGITSVDFRGNNGEVLAGTAKVVMNAAGKPQAGTFTYGEKTISVYAPGDSTFTPGKRYYLVAFPVSLTSGFSITYNKNNYEGIYSSDKSVAVSRATFAKVENKNHGLTYTKKTIFGGANCFIISSYGTASFNCRYKGNSTTSVGNIASAEVLWESFGTDVAPNVGDVVSNLTYDSANGRITFTANADGNALVAVKDAEGTILWSWHIWVCKDYDPDECKQQYNNNAGYVMDRNLGATDVTKGSVHTLGLLYQWGRKDPFLSSSSISTYTKAKSTLASWPSGVESNSTTGTIEYAVQNPTTYIRKTSSSTNYDWFYTGSSTVDNTRWQTAKTIYDPCPEGWRVPDGGESGLWATASGNSSTSGYSAAGGWDDANKGVDCAALTDHAFGSGTIWYPAGGSINYDEKMEDFGKVGRYWSCTPREKTDYHARFMLVSNSSIITAHKGYARAYAMSVRCVMESAD